MMYLHSTVLTVMVMYHSTSMASILAVVLGTYLNAMEWIPGMDTDSTIAAADRPTKAIDTSNCRNPNLAEGTDRI
jgi:hypothetical protein